ncbi:GtrA family protein [Janibacter cremeus]|uniref:Putative flippase GtrA n=1 Tax=Janibacter cremeus TaxID=1285192 RepID=A0A852VSZ2_9MICO|nr:GtrA family protein [Janibacter cremeus]NYF99099.1 putative flippase GtrA [Janibacter cremeus]
MADSTQPPAGASADVPRERAPGRLAGLIDTLWHEIAKFGVIGAVAFVIDIGGMNLLTHTVLEGKVTTARIISGVVATLFAWLGNRLWTFAHRRSRPAHHEVSLFFLVNGVALAISTLTLVLSHYGLGLTSRLSDNVATIFGIGLGTLFRFWAYRRFVFVDEPMDVDTSPLHHESIRADETGINDTPS